MMKEFASPDAHYSDLESGNPHSILSWAAKTVDRLAIATSFQSSGLVILHMLRELRPDIPVLFLDTGFHFPETLAFREHIAGLWDLKLVDLRGEHGSVDGQTRAYGPDLYRRDPDRCCFINKVKPLQDALEEYDAWISGLRRDQSPLRADTPIVEAQLLPSGSEVLKIHPLAGWTRSDVEGYVEENKIPTHPLLERSFASIGCRPCTRPVGSGENERDGRWEGLAKTECGIHTIGRRSEAEQ
jgi:phosphoadenosine phosphosulfate reductase